VLVAAYKVSSLSAPQFNFEAVFQKYKNYMKGHSTQMKDMETLSKQAFIKIFLDLVDKGFLKSESDIDILSINNKLSLGF
jgi:hypothetical protein